jgi:hypothetical protein
MAMEEINSSNNTSKELQQKSDQTPSGPSDTPVEPAPSVNHNDRRLQNASGDSHYQEARPSAATEDPGDQMKAERADAEPGLLSNITGSCRPVSLFSFSNILCIELHDSSKHDRC